MLRSILLTAFRTVSNHLRLDNPTRVRELAWTHRSAIRLIHRRAEPESRRAFGRCNLCHEETDLENLIKAGIKPLPFLIKSAMRAVQSQVVHQLNIPPVSSWMSVNIREQLASRTDSRPESRAAGASTKPSQRAHKPNTTQSPTPRFG
jgi:hypothetical protein